MKLERPKDWYEQRFALEGDVEVGAGVPPGGQPSVAEVNNIKSLDTRIAFGTFVELWRRNRGWDAVKLGEEAGLPTEEVLEIEFNPQAEPEASAVHRLAKVFGLPAKPLLELAGLIEPRTPSLKEAVVRFAARSESVTTLSPREREAFEAFVAALTESVS